MERNRDYYDDSSPILSFGELVFNLMVLNVLWFICSIPIVTIGASTSALNYTCIKMRKDEGEGTVRMFFHSLATNIRQGTVLGTMMIIILIILSAFLIQALGSMLAGKAIYTVVSVLVVLALFAWMLLFAYIFMVLARFDNSIFRTVINAVYMIVSKPLIAFKVFGTLLIMVIIIPYFLWNYFPYGFPMVIFFGMPTTAYLLSKHFNELFDPLIDNQ